MSWIIYFNNDKVSFIDIFLFFIQSGAVKRFQRGGGGKSYENRRKKITTEARLYRRNKMFAPPPPDQSLPHLLFLI